MPLRKTPHLGLPGLDSGLQSSGGTGQLQPRSRTRPLNEDDKREKPLPNTCGLSRPFRIRVPHRKTDPNLGATDKGFTYRVGRVVPRGGTTDPASPQACRILRPIDISLMDSLQSTRPTRGVWLEGHLRSQMPRYIDPHRST